MLNEEMILFALNDMDDTLLERTRRALGFRLGGKKHKARKHLRIIEDERIALIEKVHHVAESQKLLSILPLLVLLVEFNLLALTVEHHQSTLVTTIDALYVSVFVGKSAVRRIECHLIIWQLELEL